MLCKFLRILVIIFGINCVIVASSFTQDISSIDLINNAKQYDGKKVFYKGEVIGDIMPRGSFAWVNVNDGVNAIGIWVNQELLKSIAYTGSYKSRGDIIEVEGIFYRSCLEHGGDLDIHAQELKKINSGKAVFEKPDVDKRNFALVLLGVLCLVLILNQLKKK